MTMADTIAVMNSGRIEQLGTPAETYEHPATEFVAGFIGTSNVIARNGRTFTVRPEKVRLLPFEADEGEPGTIRAVVYVGPATRFVVALDDGGELSVLQQNLESSHTHALERRGAPVTLSWQRSHVVSLGPPSSSLPATELHHLEEKR